MLFMNYTSLHDNQNPSTTQVQGKNLIAILSPSIDPNSEYNWVTHMNPQNKTLPVLGKGQPSDESGVKGLDKPFVNLAM